MTNIPQEVLSDHFREVIRGRRLLAAIFATFRFDPAFFEQEILPVFLDIPLSHASSIRLVQLEDALRSVPEGVAVYYDWNGLVAETGGAKLDVRRIPVCHPTGIFHPKNVFVLLENEDCDSEGKKEKSLLVSCLSANLTRAGWWENVEVCHTEEIEQGETTRWRDDLLLFLNKLEKRTQAKGADDHAAILAIKAFLLKTGQLSQRSAQGRLHPHFFNGHTSLEKFFHDAAGSSLQGMNLEVISPYFDAAAESAPLRRLLESFQPRETRLYLPRKEGGEALCSPELFEWVEGLPNVAWGKLPQDVLKRGGSQDARSRFVHAKVYRFFSSRPKREVLFVGSTNLTNAAHNKGGNLETGFLVEVTPARPDWWLICDARVPRTFEQSMKGEDIAAGGGTRLSLRFNWDSNTAGAFWDSLHASAPLTIASQGVGLFSIGPLESGIWTDLQPSAVAELKRILASTSILEVIEPGAEPALLLVQEEGMSHRPSLLFDLTATEILRFWSLLSAEQRAAFLDTHAPQMALDGDGAALTTRYSPLDDNESMFQRFAGIFHAFGCLERNVNGSLESNNRREAIYRLFGQKYDSLGRLIGKVCEDRTARKGDPVEHYVILLCAQQLLEVVSRAHKDFWQDNREDGRRLQNSLHILAEVRQDIVTADPQTMPEFLNWFELWFLRRASSVTTEDIS